MFHRVGFYLQLSVALAVLMVSNIGQAFVATAFVSPILGVSYPKINVVTVANLVAQDAQAQEVLWVKRIMMGADQENVFSDHMIGGAGSGKPFIRQDDLKVVDGNTINIPTMAPLGGPGAQGEGDRTGNEEKIRISSFPVKIGRQWFGVGITDVAKEETVIGAQYDNIINKLLRERLGKKKTEDMLMVLKATASASNIIRPNFKSTREQLKSADTIGTTTISKAGLVLSGLGGKPVKVETTEVGSDLEIFLFFGHQYALQALKSESAYLQALQNAGVRGGGNPLFKGDFTNWDGHGIYRWLLRDHDAYGPVGSTLLPRAFLGTAITATGTSVTATNAGDVFTAVAHGLTVTTPNIAVQFYTNGGSMPTNLVAGTTYYVNTVPTADTFTVSATSGGSTFVIASDVTTLLFFSIVGVNPTLAFDITGGGDTVGPTILPAPRYFEYFSNALYTFTNGNTVAADTTTARYVLIMNLTGADAGKVGFYQYKVNDGNKLTVTLRLSSQVSGIANTTVGGVIYNTAPWTAAAVGNFAGLTDDHPSGSLIIETNSFGVPICGSLMLGEAAGVCGHGRLKGRNAMAARTEQEGNHGMDHGIGIETVYGSAATKRTDGKTPNYVYVESTYPVDGLPTVA